MSRLARVEWMPSALRLAEDPIRGDASFARVPPACSGKLPLTLVAALIEQCLFAGTNFVVTILLVRWMPIGQVGAFSFGYSSFLLTLMIYEAIVTEPIPIIGPARYAAKIKLYSGAILCSYASTAALASAILTSVAVFCFAISSAMLADALLGAAIAAPLLFLRPIIQQLCYIRSRAGIFAVAGFVYAVETPIFLYLLHATKWLNAASALAAMGVATAIPAMAVIIVVLRPELRPSRVCGSLRDVTLAHWRYGRWSTIGYATQWIALNAYYMVGPTLIGLDEVAAIRPIFNLVLPIQMAVVSITSASVPTLATALHGKDARQFQTLVWLLGTGALLFAVGYSSLLVVSGRTAIHFIYRGAFDSLLTLPLILSLAIIPITHAVNCLLDVQLRVRGRIKQVAGMKMLWAASTMTLGIGTCAWLGLTGVFIGWAMCSAIVLAGNVLVSRRFSQELADAPPHDAHHLGI